MRGCPNCHVPMPVQTVDTHPGLPSVEIDACAPCNLFWFDRSESIRLAPAAVLELFQFIGKAGRPRNALASSLRCPRCVTALVLTHDVQRNTRFTYWRCRNGHGRLTTFHQFLREKNFIRAPSAAELAKLRATVRQVSCSQCGAPIDLVTDTACRHCGAPVALIDPDGVADTVRELASDVRASAPPDPETMRRLLRDAQIDAILEFERMRPPEDEKNLVSIGASAIGSLVAGLLRTI